MYSSRKGWRSSFRMHTVQLCCTQVYASEILMVDHRKLHLGVKRDGPQKVLLKLTSRLLQMKEWPQATPCFMPYLVNCNIYKSESLGIRRCRPLWLYALLKLTYHQFQTKSKKHYGRNIALLPFLDTSLLFHLFYSISTSHVSQNIHIRTPKVLTLSQFFITHQV